MFTNWSNEFKCLKWNFKICLPYDCKPHNEQLRVPRSYRSRRVPLYRSHHRLASRVGDWHTTSRKQAKCHDRMAIWLSFQTLRNGTNDSKEVEQMYNDFLGSSQVSSGSLELLKRLKQLPYSESLTPLLRFINKFKK